MLFYDIVDHPVGGTETMQQYAFVVSKNGVNIRRETINGWEILIQWKYGSFKWENMKYLKEWYPLQLAEYYHQNQISQEPEFECWVPHVTNERNKIISKVKSKYWTYIHK